MPGPRLLSPARLAGTAPLPRLLFSSKPAAHAWPPCLKRHALLMTSTQGAGNPDTAGEEAHVAPARRTTSVPALEAGAFQRLPMVPPARELIATSLRRASRVGPNPKLKNESARARNRAARAMDTLMKDVCGPLATFRDAFPPHDRLHAFDAALLELTVGTERYTRTLRQLEAFRKATVQWTKAFAGRAARAAGKREAVLLRDEALQSIGASLEKGGVVLDELKEVAMVLRKLPVVDAAGCTVALVGAPNVGKSSLVQQLSSGLPEIRDYPFTTRSIKVGHFYVDGRRHQLTDTPGLLPRPDSQRNAMERLTLATLLHLPTLVLHVTDLTADCGMPLAEQWAVRQELRSRFPDKPWIDVLSKADLLGDAFAEGDALRAAGPGRAQPDRLDRAADWVAAVPKAVRASARTGAGVEELKSRLAELIRRQLRERGEQ